jgi:biotin carboxyl carrier protein
MARINVLSPTAGTVWKIEMKPGDKIGEDDSIMILEAMKMEIPVTSESIGTLVEILVAEADPVSEDQVVAVIETEARGA